MESFGVAPHEVCWYSFEEQMQLQDTEAMAQLLEAQLSGGGGDIGSMFWPTYNDEAAAFCSSLAQGYSGNANIGIESCYLSVPNAYCSSIGEEQLAASFFQIDPTNQFEGLISCPNDESSDCDAAADQQSLQNKRKFQDDGCSAAAVSADSPKKNGRTSSTAQKRRKRSQKAQRSCGAGIEDEINNGGLNAQSASSSNSEEDESNASQEFNEGRSASCSSKGSTALNLNGKARAGRGAATDPQSLYARKRRERINERLRILQNLVPNGTKVDISTMLEEAVQYVKFLQLQIKLLSSDELWMYAPLAYNGMSIGLDLIVPSSKK